MLDPSSSWINCGNPQDIEDTDIKRRASSDDSPQSHRTNPQQQQGSYAEKLWETAHSALPRESMVMFQQEWSDILPCNPCNPTADDATLGIRPVEPDFPVVSKDAGSAAARSTETPYDRRRQRHERRVQTVVDQSENFSASVPFSEIQADSTLERNISELTMRSSYGHHNVLAKLPDNRRMAYYAVGKHHKHGRGGNRRCYFTGKLILNTCFYAGTVQQGLRTLVVFCLPSALNLPDRRSVSDCPRPPSLRSNPRRSSRNCGSSVGSKFSSSLDDLSLSIDGDLDPNWGLDQDYLLSVLPLANANLVAQMKRTYPEQFETLPVPVREPSCWKLYVNFCFFSGLPIAENELHYKVRDDLADQLYGEEIVLSHEVMEAVNGESAEILMLPNHKTFKYLQKHYAPQCSKLDASIFQRTSWERVAPEV